MNVCASDFEKRKMPRYYFDLRRADALVVDDEGCEISNLQAVEVEAALSLIELMRNSPTVTTPCSQPSIEIRDDTGPVMNVRLRFEIEKA